MNILLLMDKQSQANELEWQQNTVDAINWFLEFQLQDVVWSSAFQLACLYTLSIAKAHALHWCFVALGLQHRKVHTTFTSLRTCNLENRGVSRQASHIIGI